MKQINVGKLNKLGYVYACVTDEIGYTSGHITELREYLMIDNKTIKNQIIYKDKIGYAMITNTTFRNCTFFCVGIFLDTIFENCTFENCRFINCVVYDSFLQNVAFFNCNMFDSIIFPHNTRISSVWRIGCKTTYRQFKGYEEMFL